MRYNGAKESIQHKKLKTYISNNIKGDSRFSNVAEEKTVKSVTIEKQYRRPDVSANFNDKKLVFEIQLSSTFLSVITEREAFYAQEKTFIMWVFDKFTNGGTLFTEKDIYYGNKKNAFVITDESRIETEKEGELVLEVQYRIPEIINGAIKDNPASKLVKFSDLTFDYDNYKVFYYDYDSKKEEKEKLYQLELK